MQRGFDTQMTIPGWYCTCGIFNSAEKEWLTHCRGGDCGEPRYAITANEINPRIELCGRIVMASDNRMGDCIKPKNHLSYCDSEEELNAF